MDSFEYRDGELWAEKVRVAKIAAESGTPTFVYSSATFLGHFDRLTAAFSAVDPLVCYSVKSCPNISILRLLTKRGSGFDVVSGGELHRVRLAGGDPGRVVFAGVGKSEREIDEAIGAKIGLFNVESEAELEVLRERAARHGATVTAALRVNPDVDAHTHEYTTTGTKQTKFGVDLERARAVFERAGRDGPVRMRGLHIHLGSPIQSVKPYLLAIEKVLRCVDELRGAGHTVDTLDIGGGYGAHYRGEEAPDATTYAAAIVPLLRDRGLRIILEPGRSISANSGVLVTRVEYVKESGGRKFVICDAGMNDLIRPALYDAFHFIWPIQPAAGATPASRDASAGAAGAAEVDVVGPVCETGDFLGKGRRLPALRRGDLLAVFTAGAYGMSMSSQYNSRPRAAEVLVEGETWRVIRRRESYGDLVAAEVV